MHAVAYETATATNNWAPVLSLVNESSKLVMKLTGWIGGTGTPPTLTNVYVGTTGYVADAISAVDLSPNASSVSQDPNNTLTIGTDGGLYSIPEFKTTNW